MNVLLTMALLGCPVTTIDNKSAVWDKQDQQALTTATTGCERQYGKAFRCLKLFTKVEQGTYRAICGAPVKKQQ